MMRVLRRLRAGTMAPPRADWNEIFWAWAGSCLSITCLAMLERLSAQEWNLPLLIGSFGASAVLAFGAPTARWPSPATLWAATFFLPWWALPASYCSATILFWPLVWLFPQPLPSCTQPRPCTLQAAQLP